MSNIVSPYKDPAEIHHMRKFGDRIITGFFVFVFGALWFFSTQYYLKPKKYEIVIYDVYGKELKQNQIRTEFSRIEVAQSYIKEYQNTFSHLSFSIKSEFPEMKKRLVFSRILKKDHR